jgi:hypothetical protein
LQALIREMAQDNATWGQERIANELVLKLGFPLGYFEPWNAWDLAQSL